MQKMEKICSFQDPAIGAAEEVCTILSVEYETLCQQRRQQQQEKKKKSFWILQAFYSYYYSTSNSIWRRRWPTWETTRRDLLPQERKPFRLATFGPGIESNFPVPLIRKLISGNQVNDLKVLECVPGTHHGLGAGIRMEFKRFQPFDFICLYSNIKTARESRSTSSTDRFLAAKNKLLKKDIDEESCLEDVLNDDVISLISSMDGLLFAINLDETNHLLLQTKELEMMLLVSKRMPILLMFCSANGLSQQPGETILLSEMCQLLFVHH